MEKTGAPGENTVDCAVSPSPTVLCAKGRWANPPVSRQASPLGPCNMRLAWLDYWYEVGLGLVECCQSQLQGSRSSVVDEQPYQPGHSITGSICGTFGCNQNQNARLVARSACYGSEKTRAPGENTVHSASPDRTSRALRSASRISAPKSATCLRPALGPPLLLRYLSIARTSHASMPLRVW